MHGCAQVWASVERVFEAHSTRRRRLRRPQTRIREGEKFYPGVIKIIVGKNKTIAGVVILSTLAEAPPLYISIDSRNLSLSLSLAKYILPIT